MIKYIYFAIIGAVLFGGILFYAKTEQPPEAPEVPEAPEKISENISINMSIDELANQTIKYINNRFLRPQGMEGEVISIKEYGEHLYVLEIRAKRGEQTQQLPPVYVTLDGKLILLGQGGGIADITEEVEVPRADIPIQEDPSLGPEDALVTVVEFSDFECPFCSAVAGYGAVINRMKSKDPTWEPPVPKLKELARKGKIRFVFKDFPLDFHPKAKKAAEAAECAHEQGKFWEMHDKIFEGQADWRVGDADIIFKKYASELNIDLAKFQECLDSDKYIPEIDEDYRHGVMAGVTGTPAFFVNGISVKGAQSFSVLIQIIDAELSGKSVNSTIEDSATCK